MGAGAEENPFMLWRRGQCQVPPVTAKEVEGEAPIGDDFRDLAGEAVLTDLEGRVGESLAHVADGTVNYEGPSSADRPNFAHGGDNTD